MTNSIQNEALCRPAALERPVAASSVAAIALLWLLPASLPQTIHRARLGEASF
jgi:hypothetical protein